MLSAYEKVTLENQIQSRTDQLHNTNPSSPAPTPTFRADVVFTPVRARKRPADQRRSDALDFRL